MPFEVKPSEKVIIDRSNVGPDDALRIVTEDVMLYCRIDPDDEYNRFRLIPGAVPRVIQEFAEKAARELIGSFRTYSMEKFEAWFNSQPGKEAGLLGLVTDQLMMTAVVRGSSNDFDSLNIGSSLRVTFNEREVVPVGMSVSIRNHRIWTAEHVVSRISPARMFDAVVWNALHN